TNGYDDVVFKGDKVFLSYTNPTGTGDPVLVQLLTGDHPSGTLLTSTILTDGATGFDTVTGKIEAIPLSDPDSMKLAANGDLILTSGADATIVDVHNAGTASQSVSFTKIKKTNSVGNAGLDDVIKPSATAGTFYLTDTKTNKVFSFHATGLNTNDYYASVGSLKAFGQVDPTTGAFTALLSADNAPGFNFSSPHGVSFTADPPQATASLANQTSAFANLISSSFATPAGHIGGNVIADAQTQHPNLAVPR